MSKTKPQTQMSKDELSIKYTNLLVHGTTTINNNTTNMTSQSELNQLLETDSKIRQTNIPWKNLSKSMKIEKLYQYIDEIIKNKYNLNEEQILITKKYIKTCLNRKKLQKSKDLKYDIENGKIIEIDGLIFKKKEQKFTLKNTNKKNNTMKNLGNCKKLKKSGLI